MLRLRIENLPSIEPKKDFPLSNLHDVFSAVFEGTNGHEAKALRDKLVSVIEFEFRNSGVPHND